MSHNKEDLIRHLEKNVNSLKGKENCIFLENIKIKCIRNLKIFGKIANYLIPFYAASAIMAGGFALAKIDITSSNSEVNKYANCVVNTTLDEKNDTASFITYDQLQNKKSDTEDDLALERIAFTMLYVYGTIGLGAIGCHFRDYTLLDKLDVIAKRYKSLPNDYSKIVTEQQKIRRKNLNYIIGK